MDRSWTLGELEEALFSLFPREDAESWDQPGLAVGDKRENVVKVALNLDMSVGAVQMAAQEGCNVLVTHHPPFIKEGPSEFGPSTQPSASGPGRLVYEAARLGVGTIALHTNADRAVSVRDRFANLLGFRCEGNFEHLMDPSCDAQEKGLGAVFACSDTNLRELSQRLFDVFGGSPRIWGDPERAVSRFAYLNGSWGDPELYDICIDNDIDCLVVGESRYHACVDAQPHLAVVELGHDISELPIVDVLADALVSLGFDESDLVKLDCSARNWWTL